MSTEENKALALRLIEEVINQGKLSALDELLTADAVDHRGCQTVLGHDPRRLSRHPRNG